MNAIEKSMYQFLHRTRLAQIRHIFLSYLNSKITDTNYSEKHIWEKVARSHIKEIQMNLPNGTLETLVECIVKDCDQEDKTISEKMKRLALAIFIAQGSFVECASTMGGRSFARFAVDMRVFFGHYIGRIIDFAIEEGLKEKTFQQLLAKLAVKKQIKFKGKFINEKGEKIDWKFKAVNEEALRKHLVQKGWQVVELIKEASQNSDSYEVDYTK